MPIRNRLRIHLIGSALPEKGEMAASIRAAANKRLGRMDFVIVPDLSGEVQGRRLSEDVGYFMALESQYLRYEADRDTKAKHLVFVDSIVDRFMRMEEAGVETGLYFMPRLKALAHESGHVFLYGPVRDDKRTNFIAKHRLPVQIWGKASDCMAEVVEAVVIGLRSGDGK